ncbi:MAG TPA: carboxypeptidase-like regulatory domain-containing protein [Acidobacteriaceae bacterium]
MKRITLLLLLFVSASAFSQEFRATLTGRVTDPTGAIIPNAVIIVMNTDTGVQVKTKSDNTGQYTTPFLLPGPYKVTVAAPGFQSYEHTNITLQASQKVQEDLQLKIGQATETVVVTTETPLVDTTTASVGQVLSAQEIEDLPSNGRSPLGFAKTEIGVVPKAKNSVVQTRPFDNSAASDFSLGGGNSQSNEYLLNGVPNNQDSSRVPGFSPNVDSVDAVRTDIFQTDASFGDTSGGTVNITTKAGTNAFHGTASEFNQFSAINAPQRWFVAPGTKTPATRQNQFGATMGGPIWIPKLVNGRNKLFFFYSFEKFVDSVPNAVTSTVPTDAERTGDFSALLPLGCSTNGGYNSATGLCVNGNPSTYQLYDPSSGVSSGGKITRNRLSFNKIAQINPVSQALLQFYPHPNLAGASDGENNFFSNVPTRDDYNSHAGRLDWSINDNNKLFFETHRSEYVKTQSNIFNNISTGTSSYNVYNGGIIDYIHTFNASTTMDVRGSITRAYANAALSSQGFDPTKVGFPSYLTSSATELVMPRIAFSETGVAFAGLSTNAGNLSAFTTYQIFAGVTRVQGHHTLKFGPDLRLEKYAKLSPGNPTGSFSFGNTFVNAGTGGATIPYGASFASFLYGIPTSGSQTTATPTMYNAAYFAGFIQDDWRVRPSLTLNLGLRLERETPVNESHNYAVVAFDSNAANSATAGAIAAYNSIYSSSKTPELPAASFHPTGGVTYADPNHRSEYNTAPVYVSPRFGLSFAPARFNGKTVFRVGYGIFVNPFNDFNTPQSYGFTATTAYTFNSTTNVTPPLTLSDPFAASVAPLLKPTGNALGVNTNLGAGVQYRGPNLHVPYAQRWNLDIQQQLTRNLVMDIGYVGAHQVHLSYSNSVSSAPLLPYLSRNHRADPANAALIDATHPCGQTPTQNLNCAITNPFKGLPNVTGTYATNATILKYNLLQAYPEFSAVTQGLVPGASATYNELLARLHLRTQAGLTFNANYEYSRNLITSQMNAGETQLQYGESTSDYPHHFSFTGSYQLPFGRNARFLSHGVLIDALVGGFQVNTIYQFLSGTPLQWGSTGNNGAFDFATGSNGYNQDFQVHPRNFGHAFNTAAFYTGSGAGYANCLSGKGTCDPTDTGQPSGTYNYRTAPMYFFRSDFTNDLDASIIKNFHFGERFKLEYRFEAFNVLNHTQFGAPNVGPTSSTFGTISTISSVNRTLQQGLRVQF